MPMLLKAIIAAACLTPSLAAAQAPTPPPDFHIETTATGQVQATLTDYWQTPNMAPRQWAAFVVRPPDVPCQKLISATLSLPGYQYQSGAGLELSALHRPILWVRVDVDPARASRSLATTATYRVALFSRRMVPGKPPAPVAALSPAECLVNTQASRTEDFTAPLFQQWLREYSLKRGPGEAILDFAHRVYEAVRGTQTYEYSSTQDKRASATCWAGKTDCAGLSYLFVAALRASGIPAHALVGRLAKSTATPQDNGQTHVKSEFFAEGVGWVPVDMSYGVGTKGEAGEQYFGSDAGDLVVMHVDTDILLHAMGTDHDSEGIQGVSHWVSGLGKLDTTEDKTDWVVTPLPH